LYFITWIAAKEATQGLLQPQEELSGEDGHVDDLGEAGAVAWRPRPGSHRIRVGAVVPVIKTDKLRNVQWHWRFV
jgi:hypothetical protein